MHAEPALAHVARIVGDVLAERGPLTHSALLAAMRRVPQLQGFDHEAILDALTHAGVVDWPQRLPDGRWVDLWSTMVDRVVTHRLTAWEIDHGVVPVEPDLVPMLLIVNQVPYFRTGEPMGDHRLTDVPLDSPELVGAVVVTLPDNLPDGVGPGDRIGFQVTGAGVVLSKVARAQRWPDGVVEALVTLVDDHPEGLPAPQVAGMLCVQFPELFRRGQRPFGELVAAAGVVLHDGYLLPADTDLDMWATEQAAHAIAVRYEVDSTTAVTVLLLVIVVRLQILAVADRLEDVQGALLDIPGAEETVPNDVEIEDLYQSLTDAGALAALTVPGAAHAVRDMCLMDGSSRQLVAAALLDVTAAVATRYDVDADPAAHALLLWLQALAQEWLGQVDEAERLLLAARETAPSWGPVLADLARWECDRGHLGPAKDLARRAGLAALPELVSVLDQASALAVRDLGRNRLCWCGSRRKYKACHFGREELSLADRSVWLYSKAVIYAWTHYHPMLDDLVEAIGADLPGHDPTVAAVLSMTAEDIAVVEGGVFDEFLRVRGHLLPDDEQELAGVWLGHGRCLWEVVSVGPGRVTMRDVRTGEKREVHSPGDHTQDEVGAMAYGRVLPVGGTWRVIGGLRPVLDEEREYFLDLVDEDLSPEQLAQAMAVDVDLSGLDTPGQTHADAVLTVPRDKARRLLNRDWMPMADEQVGTIWCNGDETWVYFEGRNLCVHADNDETMDSALDDLLALPGAVLVHRGHHVD
ncbi:MAG: SEC-C domain-containing protein [Micrococcales bacterium]|nr:SEC-C domain-containing protein [Micrococcales bacterium]